jgi:hypothetical protein
MSQISDEAGASYASTVTTALNDIIVCGITIML